jgi:hypothetical protein
MYKIYDNEIKVIEHENGITIECGVYTDDENNLKFGDNIPIHSYNDIDNKIKQKIKNYIIDNKKLSIYIDKISFKDYIIVFIEFCDIIDCCYRTIGINVIVIDKNTNKIINTTYIKYE